MNESVWLWPSEDMDFWKIINDDSIVNIKWSRDCFEDYKRLAFDFYECGYKTFVEVVSSGHDNIKSDMWFLPGIFLVRQGIELGLKSLLCKVCKNNKDIQDSFLECCHDVSMLFKKYCNLAANSFLTTTEEAWLFFLQQQPAQK